mmetsp:Transcript_45575/g.73462  ORF Transcript_45575/g.73462 Transcript_45575/m.73462 type:complete len:419 (+) Transcript_45575:134-1390(+)|eukprot:CAMPEP_0179429876 /NCGR_PEP_ID=MMETSP0799-20121207/15145_1 /TAXON_ID=46947 /ORGANISM="Geminigera cryophila, Strain CCMP2564" /LENGTH=418 /DNA_ID=CAMNT_0021206003 /DNA_START=132 /DNA_END=1388 /DNA_ORIENTATION=+
MDAAITDGPGESAHTHPHHEERHEEGEEDDEVPGEHDERGPEQGAEQHQGGEHEAHGSHDDGSDGVEGDADQGHDEDEHESGHVGADGSHEDPQHQQHHQHQQVQDALHHQHHEHHHHPDAAGLNWGPPYVQLTVKIADHQVNGAYRYKAWLHYRDVVIQRLAGWQLMASGPDFATFNVPQGLVAAASAEKHAKTPKEERRFWGDKTDFCRCLETILNEQEPSYRMTPTPSSYVLYCQEKRQDHKDAGNTLTLDVRTLGAMWRQLTEEERKPYNDKSEVLKSEGHGFEARKTSRKPCTLPSSGPAATSVALIPATVTECCAQNGLDPLEVLVRLLEAKAPRELITFERRLRVVMNKLHEKQFVMAQNVKDWDRVDSRIGTLSGVKRKKKTAAEQAPRMLVSQTHLRIATGMDMPSNES